MRRHQPDNRPLSRHRLSLGLESLEQREARLARLDALLQRTFTARRKQRGDDRSGRPGGGTAGFTLVELLIVLTVILILVAMGLGYFQQALRRSAVDSGAAAIVGASDVARQLAMLDNRTGDRCYYGVRLQDTGPGAPATVAVIVNEDGRTSVAERPDGTPIYRIALPSTAVVWQGDRDLQGGDGQLEWYYDEGSGQLLALGANEVLSRYVFVGLDPLVVESAWGLPDNQGAAHAIAPASPGVPGLSVRSTDNRYRVAVGIHPNGIAASRVIDPDSRAGREDSQP